MVDPENVCFPVTLKTKAWAEEISWSIGFCSNTTVYTKKDKFIEDCCLPSGDYTLTCKDSYGDGWNGGSIEIYGKTYCDNFIAGHELMIPIKISTSLPAEGKYQ